MIRRRLAAPIDPLADDPVRYGKPLQGAGAYRSSRAGGLRVLYAVDEAARVVHVYTHRATRRHLWRGSVRGGPW